jgi:hypothetical protein
MGQPLRILHELEAGLLELSLIQPQAKENIGGQEYSRHGKTEGEASCVSHRELRGWVYGIILRYRHERKMCSETSVGAEATLSLYER